jgi:F0F1-type ATP synthase epsilon subunit
MSVKNVKTIKVVILNREQVVYQGEALSVTSINDKGPFDILPHHQNFISLIRDKVVIRPPGGKPFQYQIKRGLLQVLADQVRIFLGIISG